MSKFLLITLLVVTITLVSQGNFESEAAIRAMGANPPISLGGYLLKDHDRSNITVIHDADGNVVKRIPVGYDYLVRAAVVASGKGQVSMVSSGQLHHKGKQIMTLGSSSTTELIGSRFMGIVLPVVVKSVTIESRGRYSVDQKNQSGSYTLKGQSSFTATGHTGGTISFVTPVFQITIE